MATAWVRTFVCTLIVASVVGLPATLLEDVKEAELHAGTRNANKVKRAQEVVQFGNQQNRAGSSNPYYPSSEKRGSGTGTGAGTEVGASPSMYRVPGGRRDGKTVAQYEKGYRYGTGKAAMDKHVENALLKSELYGDPSAVNQYRYYGGGSESRADERSFSSPSKRSGSSGSSSAGFRPLAPRALPVSQPGTRLKRDLGMDPEDVLALLALWQQQQQQQQQQNNNNNNNNNVYRSQPNRWPTYTTDSDDFDVDVDNEDIDSEDQSTGEWLDGPVYPTGRAHYTVDRRSYYAPYQYPYRYQYQYPPQKRETAWAGFAKDKRFMVSRKRQASNPAGGIQYLAQLLGPTQHDPRVPVYHRVVL